MPPQRIYATDVGEAVGKIIPYLEDTSRTARKAIYFDGWIGLGASPVLTSVARDPPPSLMKKFSKIIHLDCSRWKSRRALQRTIAQELKLPQGVMAIFDRQDEEDDFRGIDESSRDEINDVGAEIHRVLVEHKCLVVFHNGSNDMVDLISFGIPQPEWFNTRILWTFRGRLRLNSKITQKVDRSHFYLYCYKDISLWPSSQWTLGPSPNWKSLLQKEATEIARYTCKLGATPEIAQECCLYLLSLNHEGSNIMDYNWVTHASNYWFCDGIIQAGDQFDQAWEIATALHQQIHLEDYSSNTLPDFDDDLETPPERWIFATKSNVTLPRDSTSFFLVNQSGSDPPPNGMFHRSDNLRVLRLRGCTFNFSSPPFRCCRSLRFLGLDLCKDQPQGDDEKKEILEMEFFHSLWVLDICNTDWELASSPEIIEQMAANIREVHVKKGRFWHCNFAWRQLHNLRKLRVIEPTCPWETGEMDDFTDTVKLDLLDLSKNSTIQILPSLSGAIGLKTLVLDGCVGLEHVGPEGLPPSLESFSLDAGERKDHEDRAKISAISLVGCARLMNFRLRGSLPSLEELDLSGTSVKTLDLKDVVQAPRLQQIILLGCLQLHAILWPEKGLPKLTVLRIDSLVCHVQTETHQAYATIMDMRFFQSLVFKSNVEFCWESNKFLLNLCVSPTTKVKGQSYMKEKIGPGSSGKIMGPSLPKSSIANHSYSTYTDVAIDKIIIDHDCSSALQLEPSGCHVEIGEGIVNTNVESGDGIKAIIFAMNKAESLHVHDNSSIPTVIPEHMMSIAGERKLGWHQLKWCRVERCPKLHIVFWAAGHTNDDTIYFQELETFWAADLPMAHCIWSKGRTFLKMDTITFAKLRSIHLYRCPRLTFVLPLSWFFTLSRLETLHIVSCGGLKQVFPAEIEFSRNGVLEFPELKHIYMYELPKLQHICEAKMFAPKLEKVRLRGCWSLRRLPAVDEDSHPVVECEKEWWEKLEWDGLEAGHDPSLFKPCHSSYYKKTLPRGSVLR